MLPLAGFLETLVKRLIPDDGDHRQPEQTEELDTRLLLTPSIALERCHEVADHMAEISVQAMRGGLTVLGEDSLELAPLVREQEEQSDHYEDLLGTYLVQLSTRPISEEDSAEAAKLLNVMGDFERISDHAVHLVEAEEEMKAKNLTFTQAAREELSVLAGAVEEILSLTLTAFLEEDLDTAAQVEPLEEVIHQLKEELRTRHIRRLQQGDCSIDAGFVWSDLLTDLERTADHCSNIAGCLMDMAQHKLNLHESLRAFRNESPDFRAQYDLYAAKYGLRRF
jgi:phosphate:Na+ symporter